MNPHQIWEDYRKRHNEIEQRISELRGEDYRLFRRALNLIDQGSNPYPVRSEPSGTLESETQASKNAEDDITVLSEDDREAEFTRPDHFMPNCS